MILNKLRVVVCTQALTLHPSLHPSVKTLQNIGGFRNFAAAMEKEPKRKKKLAVGAAVEGEACAHPGHLPRVGVGLRARLPPLPPLPRPPAAVERRQPYPLHVNDRQREERRMRARSLAVDASRETTQITDDTDIF